MNKTAPFAILGAAFGLLSSGAAFAADDCVKLSSSVKDSISSSPSDLLQIVERNVSANPGCACEVVKAAIEGSHANAETVASIVQTASTAAPDQMRLIAQCSLAVAPDAITNVQAVLAKLDPGTGGGSYSSKEAGSYLFAKSTRLGKAEPTKSPNHFRVIDTHGVFLGDLNAENAVDVRVRATSTTNTGATWVYVPHVPVPGEGWTRVPGGILTIHSAEDGNFYLQYNDQAFNPLNLPGSPSTSILPPPTLGGSGVLPPGPGTNVPPVISPPSATSTGFTPPPVP